MAFERLLTPITIGNMTLKNRMTVAPMGSEHAGEDGSVTDDFIAYWEARAKGGWALCVTEFTAVDPRGLAIPHQLRADDDKYIPGLTKLADMFHKYDCKCALELHHAGRGTNTALTDGVLLGPSPIPEPTSGEIPHELTTEEVYEIIEMFGDAALRAKKAGFDCVELHGAHGYLICQFMSPFSNRRFDEFGGDLYNRCRFAVLIRENIAKKCGKDFVVGIRLSASEHYQGSLNIQETKCIIPILEEAGYDYFDISNGNYVAHDYSHAVGAVVPGYNVMNCEEIRKVTNKPLFAVGRLADPYLAEGMLRSGDVDVIPMGRGSLADPEFPNKVMEGRIDEISPCILCMQGCQGKSYDASKMWVASCTLNPFTGRETELIIRPAENAKKVVIVGAGPGGLEAAWRLASRGHQVVVFEKDSQPGGQFRIAAVPPTKQNYTRAINHWLVMCKKYGVEIRYNTEATVENIAAEEPDEIILATGAKPFHPPIEGIDTAKWVYAHDVLAGKVKVGDEVLVVGGGLVGVETADYLGEQLHHVTLIEMTDEIAMGEQDAIKHWMFERFKQWGIEVHVEATLMELQKRYAIVEIDDEEVKMGRFDNIVFASGVKPYNPLEEPLKEAGFNPYVIGDAVGPRRDALHAVYEGAKLGIDL